MALFSDVDWVIIAVVAAFLFLGPQGQPLVRQMGRWYGRLLQFKGELLSEVTASTGMDSAPSTASSSSIREALFGPGPTDRADPETVILPSHIGFLTQVQPVAFWAVETRGLGAGLGAETWWVTTSSAPGEVVRLR